MPAPLRCPACSAPLDIPPEHATTARCAYCGAGVMLTERAGNVQASLARLRHADAIGDVLALLRAGSRIAAVRAYREHFGVGLAEAKYAVERLAAGQSPDARPARTSQGRGALLVAGVVGVLIVAAPIFVAWRGRTEIGITAASTSVDRLTGARGDARGRAFARPVLRFGSEGVGAGRFQDAQSVAVDGTGRIYVAESYGGRVQVFDSAGVFITQWMAEPDPLMDLAADRGGTVYVLQSGYIRRYEGATGRPLGQIARPRLRGYEDVALALDGSLWAVSDYSIVHLGRDGDVRRTIDLKAAVDERAAPERVAVDANGHLYVLDRYKGQVYHLDPAGRFIDRFEAGDDGPVGHVTPNHIVLDGHGRVYVSQRSGGVRVYDASGRLLGAFGGGDAVFALAFDDRDHLFAAQGKHQIVEYRIPD